MKGFLPWLVRWALHADPALTALVIPVKNIFPHRTLSQFFCKLGRWLCRVACILIYVSGGNTEIHLYSRDGTALQRYSFIPPPLPSRNINIYALRIGLGNIPYEPQRNQETNAKSSFYTGIIGDIVGVGGGKGCSTPRPTQAKNSPVKVHKNENFFGFDFEFCTIPLLVMHK